MTRSYLTMVSGTPGPCVGFSEGGAHDAEMREVLEQAKGMLMVMFGLDPDRARDLLQSWSRELDVSPHTLALILTLRASADLTPLQPPRHLLGDRP